MVNNYNRALGEIFEGNLSTLILGPFFITNETSQGEGGEESRLS